MQSMAAIVLVTFVWITVGFTISFGKGIYGSEIGNILFLIM